MTPETDTEKFEIAMAFIAEGATVDAAWEMATQALTLFCCGHHAVDFLFASPEVVAARREGLMRYRC
jgi:hypothetical protein